MANINIIPKFVQALLVPGDEAGLEVDAEGTKYEYCPCSVNVMQNKITS